MEALRMDNRANKKGGADEEFLGKRKLETQESQKHRKELQHGFKQLRKLREETGFNFVIDESPETILIERLLGLCNNFYDIREAEFDSKFGETAWRSPPENWGRPGLHDFPNMPIADNTRLTHEDEESDANSHGIEPSLPDSDSESDFDSEEFNRRPFKKGPLVAVEEGVEPASKKFVITNNSQINDIVRFFEEIFIHDNFDGELYKGFDRFQKHIVDNTCGLFMVVHPESISTGKGTIKDDDFRGKRRDEKTKIIMSIILKSIVRKYKKKLKIPGVVRRKNLYLAIYYHFAYKGENYKLVGNLPDKEQRYKIAEEAFKTRKGLTKPFVEKMHPSFLAKILEIGRNVEFLENAYKRRVTSMLWHLFKSFDKRFLENEIKEFALERPEENKIPTRIYYTIMKRLTSKTTSGVSSCKIPLSLRFIREYADYTVSRLMSFHSPTGSIQHDGPTDD